MPSAPVVLPPTQAQVDQEVGEKQEEDGGGAQELLVGLPHALWLLGRFGRSFFNKAGMLVNRPGVAGAFL